MNRNLILSNKIVDLRNEGYSIQEISDILASEYGIYKTRQAVYSLYKRTGGKIQKEDSDIEDVINVMALKSNLKEACRELNEKGSNIKYGKAYKIFTNHADRIESMKEEIIVKIQGYIKDKAFKSLVELKEKISYKGIVIDEDILLEYYYKAVENNIREYIIDSAIAMGRMTGDLNLSKKLGRSFNENLSVTDFR